MRNANTLAHRPGRPMRCILRRRLVQRQIQHHRDLIVRELGNTRRSCLIPQKPVHALLDIALLPAPYRRLTKACPPHDLSGAVPFASQQDHLRPPDMLLLAITVGDDRCQSLTIRRTYKKTEVPSHAKRVTQNLRIWTLMFLTNH